MPSTYASYDEVVASNLLQKILWRVIAREGKSKNYKDLLPLDGGTVGIAHFAVGGLASLYQEMDTQVFFSRSRQDMIEHFSAACRPEGRRGDDDGWGCHSQAWWNEGMQAFLASADAQAVQHRAWARLMRSTIVAVLDKGWNSERELAIALGIANSLGGGGFSRLAQECDWDAEATLARYASESAHHLRRRDALDAAFPRA